MKKFLSIFALLSMFLTSSICLAEEQKFTVEITTTFEAKTLQELADKEKEIRKMLKGSKDVDISIKFDNGDKLYLPNNGI